MKTLFKLLPFALLAASAIAQSLPDSSVATSASAPKPRWVSTSVGVNKIPVKWANNHAQWYFNPANIPLPHPEIRQLEALTQDGVLTAMKEAAAQWMQVCNINIEYKGLTNAAPIRGDDVIDGNSVWGFTYLQGMTSGFAAPAIRRTYEQGLPIAGTIVSASIEVNANDRAFEYTALRGVMVHEIGHAIGISHSDMTWAVMAENAFHGSDYDQWLRSDDIGACLVAYGEAPYSKANRVFNWAENTYPVFRNTYKTPFFNDVNSVYGFTTFHNRPSTTVQGDGFIFRHYPQSDSYLGSMDGSIYYMGPDRVLQNVGKVLDFMPAVIAARF
jgi:predicted Zn-dependent protease with MMP-like domain